MLENLSLRQQVVCVFGAPSESVVRATMASGAAPTIQTQRTYEQYRNELIAGGITLPALVVSLLTGVYSASEAFFAPHRFEPARWAYLIQTLTPLVTCWLCRGRLRQHAQLVLLGGDLIYTLAILLIALQPTTDISGAALAIAVKLMATAVFFPWHPRLQYISASATILGYWLVLYPGGRVEGPDHALFETLAPCIAALLSAAGATGVDRDRRAMFEQGHQLAEAESAGRQQLATLQSRETQLRLVLQQMPAALWLTDRDLYFTAAMGAALESFQLPMDTRSSLYDFFQTRDDTCPPVAAHRRALDGGSQSYEFESAGRAFHTHVEPLKDSSGVVVGTIAVAYDITDRKRAEDASRQLELQRADFLSMVTHDLKQPIATVMVYAALLRKASGPPHVVEHHLNAIEQSGRQQLELVNNYLDLSRIEAGAVKLSSGSIVLDDVLARVCTDYTERAQQRGIRLNVQHEDSGLLAVVGDRLALERVLANLLSNALKFTSDGGEISVCAQEDGPSVVVKVADTGPGIAAEDIPSLFDRYRQTERGRNQGGTGIGLFIVKSLIEAQGGSVGVESVVGHGATFSVRLPRAEPPS